ncbi:MAG: radical SAM protein [Deltaproteobacteria bacterium]|nr:radical SAM protein [Deltaproteobacteria bacterium]
MDATQKPEWLDSDPAKSVRPRVLVLMLTERCNFACAFCGYRAEGGEMPFEKACGVVAEAGDLGVDTAVLTGGEPLLHPRVHDVVAYCKTCGMGVNVTTNGWLVEREARRMVAAGVDSVSFSIDGCAATHDRLRGRQGAHAAAIAGIEALKKARREIVINVNFVVTRGNVRDLEASLIEARRLGAEFNFWPVNNVPGMNLRPGEEIETYLAFVEKHVRTDPVLGPRYEFYRTAAEYHEKGGLCVRCLGSDDSLNVNWNGDVLPCCLWSDADLVLGNAFERSLADILHDKATRARLGKIRESGCRNRCYNHALYEFQLRTGLPFVLR